MFKYLGRVLTAVDDNWQAVTGNLWKARKSWARLERIMGREGSSTQVSEIFFKTVVQAVLLFGSETWVPTPPMGWALGSLQYRVARRIAGRQTKQQEDWGWEYTPLEADMEEDRFEEMIDYVLNRKNNVAQYIATRPILDLCKKTVRRPGACVARIWWE